jgi:hypothetical protein
MSSSIIYALISSSSVAVSQSWLEQCALGIVASTLKPGEERVVVRRLREVLSV